MGARTELLRFALLAALMVCIDAAPACSPVPYSPRELASNRDIGFVKCHIRWIGRADDGLIFVVEESLRGNIPKGEYRLSEGGPLGNMCEYGEIPATFPRLSSPQPDDETVYLPVGHRREGVLVTSFDWSRGIGIEHGYVVSRSDGVRIPKAAFERRLRSRFAVGVAGWSRIPQVAAPSVE